MRSVNNSTGWIITFAALGINLVLGVLYSWSVIGKALVNDWGWTNTEASLPYTFSAAIFAVMMIFAGRAQDKFGPKFVAMFGGLMLGCGLIASGFAQSPIIMILTFGVVGGIGIGLGYSAATPCAIKWFEPNKKGLITGIVVSGVGLSPVYIAPLTAFLLGSYGIQQTFIILGFGAIIVVVLLSMFLNNPPEGFIPPNKAGNAKPSANNINITWSSVLKTRQFYLLWLMYMLTAAAGLMLIGHLAIIADRQAAWKAGFVLVIILSVFNAFGRIAAGLLSDKVGRTTAMMIVFLLQAVNMFAFSFYNTIPLLAVGSAIAGLGYGALFSLFPATTADYFGIKNLGVNYGLIFTGWGIAGVLGPIIGGIVVDKTGVYTISYLISAFMLLIGVVLVKIIKKPAV